MRPAIWIASCVALATACSLVSERAFSQKLVKDAEPVGYLPAPELRGEQRNRFSDLYHGREPVREDDRPILQKAAEYYINRLTHPEYRNGTAEAKMHGLVTDVMGIVPAYDPKRTVVANQRVFVQIFGKNLQVQLEKVLKTEWTISHINAAIILDQLARAGYEDVADTLIQVLEDDKESDAAKLYALRGLKHLFALQHMQPPIPIKDKKREARCITALLKYLARPGSWREVPPEPEIEAFRWVRREAVEALALTRYPRLEDAQRMAIGTPTAFGLLRVCCRNDFNPEPSLKEQIEAAIGVCQLKARQATGYNIDYAAYYLGWSLRDFIMQYLTDTDRKTQAWKVQALRLRVALQSLKEDADTIKRTDRAAADYVNKIVAKFDPILAAIEAQTPPDTTDLKPWLEANAPQGKTSLFQDDQGKTALKRPAEQ